MIPGVNPKLMKQAMKRMGIKEEPIDAVEVIIRTHDKELIVRNPEVSKVSLMGQETIQIVGEIEERSLDSSEGNEISKEDIKTVALQADVSEEKAKEALEEAEGDLAEAIINLQSKNHQGEGQDS